MSISQEKLQSLREKAIEELLKEGIYPSFTEVNKRLNEKLSIKSETVVYKNIEAEEHSLSSSSNYDNMFKSLEEDLRFAYSLNKRYTRKISEFYENSYVELDMIEKEIEKLNIRRENIEELMAQNINSQTKIINFDNFYDIEFDGDDSKNVPATTAFIDLNTRTASLNRMPQIIKHDLKDAEIIIENSSESKNIEVFNSIASVLNDNSYESFVYKVSKDTEESMSAIITVRLKEKLLSNLLTLSYTSNFDTEAILYLSNDGVNYFKQSSFKGLSITEWNFKEQEIKSFKIVLLKTLPEKENYKEYTYHFIINNISLYKESYRTKDILVSAPLKFNSIINSAKISAKDNKDYLTSVEYFLGIKDVNEKTSWFPVENNDSFKLNILKTDRKIINGLSLEEGQSLIKLYSLKNIYSMNSIKIYPGYQMWKVEKFTLRKNINHVPSMSDYKLENLISTEYVDSDDCLITLKGYNLAVMTQYIYCDNEYVASSRFIRGQGNYQIASRVFVNNNEIKPVNSQYNLKFKKGKNKVNIFIYCPALTNADADIDHEINHNINLKDISFNIFAEYKMNYVTPNVLLDKTLRNDLKYFSVEGNDILIKNSRNSFGDIKYLITYNYLDEKSINKNTELRVMAVLQSPSEDVTPKVSNIKITVE